MKAHIYAILIGLSMMAGCSSGQDEPSSFKWNLGNEAFYSYEVAQDGIVTIIDNEGDEQQTKILVDAVIDVSPMDSTTAFLNMHDMVFTMIGLDSAGQARDTSVNAMPNLEMGGMGTRGQFRNEEGQVFFGLLFPLPSKDLSPGMTDTLQLSIPVSVGMFTMYIKGQKIITFKGLEKVDGKEYGVFESSLVSTDLEIPEEAEDEYYYSENMNGTHYFDLEDGAYFSSEISVERSTRTVLYDSISSTVKNQYTYKLQRK